MHKKGTTFSLNHMHHLKVGSWHIKVAQKGGWTLHIVEK
jgi:hypothetical protein